MVLQPPKVGTKRKREEESEMKTLCRTLGAWMQQMHQNTTAPAAVAPVPTISNPVSMAPPPSGPSQVLSPPDFDLTNEPFQELQEEEEEKGLFLFQLAQKYNMPWAVKGDTPCPQSELGRPSAIKSEDKMMLTPGAGIDVMTHVNNHLHVPALDVLPENFKLLLEEAPRRIKLFSSSEYKPIPMAGYTTEVSGLGAFLDGNMSGPLSSFLQKPFFPGPMNFSRFMVLAALEGITALNMLHELPRAASDEDRASLSDHIGGILYAILHKGAENIGAITRAVRLTQLGSLSRAIKDELVNQPILGSTLYTDDKKVGLAAQPPPKRARFFHKQGNQGAPSTSAAFGSSSGGFQPQGSYSTQRFAPAGRRSRPFSRPGNRNFRGNRGGRRGRR